MKNRDRKGYDITPYSPALKGLFVVLQQATLLLMVLGLLIAFVYSNFRTEGFAMFQNPRFEQSGLITSMVESDSERLFAFVKRAAYVGAAREETPRAASLYLPDDLVDADRFVDVTAYARDFDEALIALDDAHEGLEEEDLKTGYGLRYSVGDLYQWSHFYSSEVIHEMQTIWECAKEDGSVVYYDAAEYTDLVSDGRLYIKDLPTGSIMQLKPQSDQELTDPLDENSGKTDVVLFEPGTISEEEIKSRVGIIYTGARSFQAPAEEYLPDGADSLVDAGNQIQKLNGRLEEACADLEQVLDTFDEDIALYREDCAFFLRGNSNFIYTVRDLQSGDVFTNEENMMEGLNKDQALYYHIEETLESFETNLPIQASRLQEIVREAQGGAMRRYAADVVLDESFSIPDTYRDAKTSYESYATAMPGILLLSILSAGGFLLSTVWLSIVSGKRERGGEIYLQKIDSWPWDLILVAVVALSLLTHLAVSAIGRRPLADGNHAWQLLRVAIDTVVAGSLTAAFYFSMVRRIKRGSIAGQTAIERLVRALRPEVVRERRLVKVILGYLAFISYNLVSVSSRVPLLIVTAIILDAVVLILRVRQELAREGDMKGTAIASGSSTDENVAKKTKVEIKKDENKEGRNKEGRE